MSYDIWGNPLKKGHCEVHPQVAQPYPCDRCSAERAARGVTTNEQHKIWQLEDRIAKLEADNGHLHTALSNILYAVPAQYLPKDSPAKPREAFILEAAELLEKMKKWNQQ